MLEEVKPHRVSIPITRAITIVTIIIIERIIIRRSTTVTIINPQPSSKGKRKP